MERTRHVQYGWGSRWLRFEAGVIGRMGCREEEKKKKKKKRGGEDVMGDFIFISASELQFLLHRNFNSVQI